MPWWKPHYITVDRELVLRFFVTFARFEFALKNSGFFGPQGVPPGELRDAQPDWDAFASSIRDVFEHAQDHALSAACDYLLRLSPPAREVALGDKVVWDTTPPRPTLSLR